MKYSLMLCGVVAALLLAVAPPAQAQTTFKIPFKFESGGKKFPAGEYTGLQFRVGVPPELNHLDAAVAPAPLNDPGLWWARDDRSLLGRVGSG